MANLCYKIRVILKARSLGPSYDPVRDCVIMLGEDGQDYIEKWRDSVLGPRPTQEEIDAVTEQQVAEEAASLSEELSRQPLAEIDALKATVIALTERIEELEG